MKKIVAILLTASMVLSMGTACGKKTKSSVGGKASVTRETKAEDPSDPSVLERTNGKQAIFQLANTSNTMQTMSEEELKKAYSQFIFALMKECASKDKGKNVMISPDSLLFCMQMCAAGADGDTLDQMMNTMIPGADNASAFQYSVNRMNSLQNDTLSIANSVWLNQKKAKFVYSDYLDYVKHHFDANVDIIEFDDTGVATINKWVSEKTDGMIKDLIDKLQASGVMVLVNAIAFDGKWDITYDAGHIQTRDFTNGNGEKKEGKFLMSNEGVYLDNGKATGFIKVYEDGKYGFMTILPNDKSIDINDFMANMTPEEYWSFWENKDNFADVYALMPEFTSDYNIDLSDILPDMGMKDAFDERKADFSNMAHCENNVYISKVVQKTHIEVTREGTKAAAATAIYADETECIHEYHEVICDRPYAYAIVDMETGLPVFLGTVEDI